LEKGIRKAILSILTLALLSSVLASSIKFRVDATSQPAFGQQGPKMDHLQFTFYDSQAALFTGLLSNQIDFMDWRLTSAEYTTLLGNTDFQLIPYHDLSEYELAFNNNWTNTAHTTGRSAMNYTDFRNAMNCLVNKNGVIRGPILQGFATRDDTQIPQPLMAGYVNPAVSGVNYPWEFNETKALEILYNGGWYNHAIYPTLTNLLNAFADGRLATRKGTTGGVVYPANDPNGQWGGSDPGATANAFRANTPIDTLMGYVRSGDARKDLGDMFCDELNKIGCPFSETYCATLSALKPYVMLNDNPYDFATLGYGMSSPPNWWYAELTPVGIYSDGPNPYLVDDANMTYWATKAYTAPTQTEFMVDIANVQDILVMQSELVSVYSPASYCAYRKGWLGVIDNGCSGLGGSSQSGGVGLDYLMLNVQNGNYPTVNVIRYGTFNPPGSINPIFSGYQWDWEVVERLFTSCMNANPYKSMVRGKSPAGGDAPWMAYDWNFQQSNFTGGGGLGNSSISYTNCANVTLWFRHDINWTDGVPWTVDDLNFTVYMNAAYRDSWGYSDMVHVVNFVKWDNWTCSLYFDIPSYWTLYTANYEMLPQHIYKYIAIPENAAEGTSTTGLHGEWPGKSAAPSEILPGAPFTYSQLTGEDGGKYVWVGTGMWQYHSGTYMSGIGGGITLDANRGFFLYTPPAGEIDFQYYWNPGPPPQTGYYEVDQNDLALLNNALGSVGNPPSSNWNSACDIALPSGAVTDSDRAFLEVDFGVKWGYSAYTILSQPSTRYPWPMFRQSPDHMGYSESPAPTTNQTRWNYTIGADISSSPAVVDGKVYVGSNDNKIYCLDALNGTQIWNYTTGDSVVSSPAVAYGKVYVGSYDDKVYCLDALNGTQIWNYATGDIVDSSPAVNDGKVYVGSYDGKVYCLDALSGTQIWNYTTGQGVDCSPAVVDDKVYVGSNDNKIYCLDAFHGTRIWSYTTGNAVVSSPSVANGRVYVGSEDNRVYCLDASNGTQIWNYATGDIVDSSPAVNDGKVYVGSYDGTVYCLDASSGTRIWNYTTSGGWVHSSPALADGMLYVASDYGTVYCLDASSGTRIWSYEKAGIVYSSPAVADGIVFLASFTNASTSGTVYAFGNIVKAEDYSSIQTAVDAATPGATVIITKGFFNDTLFINKTLTIFGAKGSDPIFGGGGSGIYLTLGCGASGSIVTGIVITNYDQGILVVNASNCKVYNNIMSSMVHSGIVLEGNNATDNLIYNNLFEDMPTAINLTASATGNTIYQNIISSQTSIALNLQSNGNSIYANIVSAGQIGINLTSSKDNIIYHNAFAATFQISILTTGNNTWDNGYPSGGNYWCNCAKADMCSGPNQNQPGSDGINDTGFTIAVNNTDRYPLVDKMLLAFNPHDVGIASVTLSKTIVGQGYTLRISSTILNYGTSDEAPTIATYGNTTLVGVQIINLATRSSMTVNLTWNTASFAYGNYTLSVRAGPVQDEADTTDNTLSMGIVKVTIPGDLNGDFRVSLSDLSILAKAYGSTPSHPKWNPNADINDNGAVTLSDLSIMAKNYGKHYP